MNMEIEMKVKMNTKKYIALGGLAFVVFFHQLVIAEEKMGMMMDHGSATEPHFISMMTRHHQEGVDMAQVALDKSQSSEVKKVSQKIITAQTKEIAQFAKWKKQWYPDMDMSMDMNMTRDKMKMDMPLMDMTSLKTKTGKDFDSEYLSMMAMHHEGAIKMAQKAAPNLQHQEIKNLAKKIIKDQTSEIAQLDQIKKSL